MKREDISKISAEVVHRHMRAKVDEQNNFRRNIIGVLKAADNERLRRRLQQLADERPQSRSA